MSSLTKPTSSVQTVTALILLVAMAATVGIALGFEHIGGYIPCKLCLEQRWPYYAGVPLMAVAALSSHFHWPASMTRGLLLVGALLMLYSLYLGIFHSGVEWGWWAGPADCGAVATQADTGGAGVLDAIDTVIPPSCDKAPLRVLGLSFAGWNALVSLLLAIVAMRGALGKA